jgi:hypothetical protein
MTVRVNLEPMSPQGLLRNEIVREHYDAASFSTNINFEFCRVPIGWSSRMDVPSKGV